MPQPVPDVVIEQYTVEEKLDLLARVWDSLLEEGLPPMPGWHHQLLADRVEEAERAPGARIPLAEVRRKLLGDES